jgi:hypothetical protein
LSTERDKFLDTVRKDIDNGLVHLSFQRTDIVPESKEEVYGEINSMWASENLGERDEV